MPTKSVHRLFAIAVVSMLAQMAWASDSLSFFNNWFVTGDYAVAGVGLRGSAGKGNISMSGVPSGGQPIAAFLYWSTVETSSTPGAAVGLFNGNKIQGAVLGNPASPNAACGPAPTGSAGFVYRADVLRYLPVDANNIPKANGAQAVQLPATPVGTVLYTDGATLVVIYKIVTPGDPDEAPLRSVVIYNGAFTMTRGSAGMTQNVAGFYQASSNPAAKITGIVANGQHGFSSPWSVNGKNLSTNPFTGGLGADWDNPTYNISLAANASAFSTLATVSNNQTCLTWAAIVASVNVQDTDLDGLLDVWETKGLHRNTAVSPATFGACSDYPAEPCVNLPAMGANPKKQDIFIQIDWMHGAGGANGTHDHIPQLTALNSVAATFALHGISVHYDVGSYYQGPQSVCGNALCSFIIPATYAQGGHDDDESNFVCNEPPGSKHPCNYTGPVLSFEYGFASIRDGNSFLGIPAHFAQNRRDVFHYGLFAHALAGPFDVNGHPANPFTGEPAPLPATPLSYSGIAHRPGGGFMVTFGLWGSDTPAYDQVGSPQQQAGTLMHELGHNLGLGHAGLSTKPNCMPNYPSVMNYKYQTHLKDASGNIQVDYSYGLLLPMSENFLNAAIPMGLQHYRVRYFGPLAPGQSATQAAGAHCDGSPLKSGDAPEVSLEGAAISTPDWSNGTVAIGKFLPPLDVNYDGIKGQLFVDQPDWFTLNLQQIGTGYSFGGLSVGAFATDGGVFATDGGAFATDAGALATDGGVFATDGGAFATDAGAFATDGGVFATDGGVFATDGGAFATDAGELDENTELCSGPQAPTQLAANLGTNPTSGTGNSIVLTWTPPQAGSNLTYNIYRCAGAGCTPTAPPFKNVSGGATPATPSFTDTITDTMHAGTACPAGATCPNTTYVYAVTALATPSCGGVPTIIESLFSNTASSEVPELFVVPTATTVTYDGNPHTVTVQIFGDVPGALNSAQVTCGTERNAGTYQVSGNGVTNQITCSNPTPTPATEGVVYVASGGTVPTYTDGAGVHTPGALTINQRPITVTAAANKKTYDSTTSAAALPTITTGTLGTGDTPNFSETYYDLPAGTGKNVGMGKTLVPAGIVNDSNNGNNYSVTFTNSANGEIDAAPLTASIVGNPTVPTKQYNGNTAATLVSTNFSLSGLQGPDNFTVTQTVGAYGSANAGSTTVTASLASGNFTPLGGTVATNYTLPTGASGTGTITQAPPTVTATGATCTYNAMPCAGNGSATGVLSEPLLLPAVTLSYSGTSNSSVAYEPSATAPTDAGNYTVTASFGGNPNYFPGTSTPATITINQAAPTVTDGGPSPATPAYGQPVTLTVTIAPPQSGEAPTGTVTFSFTLNSITNYICSPNGSISTTQCSVPVTFNGTNYVATVTTSTLPTAAENVMATYSGDPNFLSEPANNVSVTVNQANSNITLTKSTDPSTYGQGVKLTVEVTDATGGSIGVPTGTVTLSFKLNPSDPGGQVYYICADGSVITTACVNPIALAPDPNNPVVGATVTVPTSALPAGLANATPTAYSYPINATYLGDTNFAHSGPFGLSQTVNPLAASVTPNAAGKVYGATDPTLAGTLNGFLPADNVSAAYSRVAGETVASSPYTISATLSPASVLNNYNITYNTANFAISTAPLAIAASSGSVPYGSVVPGITAGYSGFVNGDSYLSLTTQPSCGTNYTQGSPVPGPYATFCGSAADSNYNIAYAPGSLSVTQVNLQITASSPTITVGAAVPTITAGYSGFANGENNTNLTTQPTCSVSGYTPSSPAGNYPTSCTSAVDNNYNISYVSGTLTVNPAPVPLAITAGPVTGFQSYTYPATLLAATGGTPPYTWSGASIVGMNLTTGGVLTGYPTAAGTANVTVTDANSNSVSAPFTIAPATVSYLNFTISNVSINGSGQQITAAPGAPINVSVSYSIADSACPGCVEFIQVAFANAPPPNTCVYGPGIPGAGGASGSGSVSLTAPSVPGRYYIGIDREEDYQCNSSWWTGTPGPDRYIAVVDVIPTASVTWQNVTVTNISVTPQVHVGDQITATFTLSPPSSGMIGLGFNTDPALDQCGGLNYTTVSPTFTAPSQPGRYYLSIDNPNTCGVSTTPWTSGIPGANFAQYIGAVDVLPPHP